MPSKNVGPSKGCQNMLPKVVPSLADEESNDSPPTLLNRDSSDLILNSNLKGLRNLIEF